MKLKNLLTVSLLFAGASAMAQTTLSVIEQVNVNGSQQAFKDNSKTVAYTTANNSIWYLGCYDLSKVKSIDVVAGMVSGTDNDNVVVPQLNLAFVDYDAQTVVDAAFLSTNSGTIRSAQKMIARIEAVTEPAESAAEGHRYPGAKFTVDANGVTADTETYNGTVTLNAANSKALQKTDGVVELFVWGTAQKRRIAIDEVTIHFVDEVGGEGELSDTSNAVQDTYWRLNNKNNQANNATAEVRSDWTEADGAVTYKNDFIAAFEFAVIPEALNATVKSAVLRIVSNCAKGSNEMNVYAYPYEWADNNVYENQTENIAAARATDPIATFTAKAVNNSRSLTDTGYDFTDISVWTNYIDVTNYVRLLSDTRLSVLVAAQRSATNVKKFYTVNAADVLAGNAQVTVPAADLVPQLTVVYEVAGKELVYVSTDRYRTFVSQQAVTIPYGVKAFVVPAYDNTENGYCAYIAGLEDGVIPANTGVILQSVVPATYSFNYTETDITVPENLLVAGTGASVASGFVFGVTDGVPGFTAIAAETVVPSSEAYLDFTVDGVAQMGVADIADRKPTAIEGIATDKPTVKGIYTLQGIRLQSIDRPGIYVIDGKKVVVTEPSLYR